MGLVCLDVLDYQGPTQWRWRLTDAGGGFLADHEVRLDETAWQYGALDDLDGYIRWRAAADEPLESSSRLVADVGRWIGEEAFGPVGPAIVAKRPVTVRLRLPAEAEFLGYRPFELAYVNDRPLALQGATMVVEFAAEQARTKMEVGDRLRMLAVFSLPVDTAALNLRRERFGLARLVEGIAATNSKAIELRELQYGVTRERLEEVLLEGEGWDVVAYFRPRLAGGIVVGAT